MAPEPPARTWIASDRPVARLIARPLRSFLDTEAAGGVVLLVAALIALAWANSPWSSSYEALWHTELTIRLGRYELVEDLRGWVNDGLMTIFFFVVGLEIKRELHSGELSDPKKAALPVVAALGGMVVPALIYVAINFSAAPEAGRGWGIPMATDIAFAVGVLALFGSRVHPSLRVFLLSLAIADDVGAILVIALFYSGGIEWGPLLLAFAALGLVALLRSARVWWVPVYVALGVGVWLAALISGIHPTVAGVALGLMTPALPLVPAEGPPEVETGEEGFTARVARRLKIRAHERVSVVERLEDALHPWSSFVIVPLFALANAGVTLDADALRSAATSTVAVGIALGLVIGKLAGITSFAWGARRLGIAALPDEVGPRELGAAAAVAGIGFTVSLFITQLAFDSPRLIDEAKIGILAASLLASLTGALLVRYAGGKPVVPPRDN